MDTKVCKKCGIERQISFFSKNKGSKDGVARCCRDCAKIDYQKYRVKILENLKLKLINDEEFREKCNYRRRTKIRNDQKYRENINEIRRQRLKNSIEEKNNRKQTKKKSLEKYPYKESARRKLKYALEMGYVIRKNCRECGDINSHGHHEDYTKPLDVIWLCSLHHAERHRALREVGLSWDMTGKPVFSSKDRSDTDEGLLLDGHV